MGKFSSMASGVKQQVMSVNVREAIMHTTTRCAYLVPKGWKLIVEEQLLENDKPIGQMLLRLDGWKARGGGQAEAMMRTLRHERERMMTRPLGRRELLDAMERTLGEDADADERWQQIVTKVGQGRTSKSLTVADHEIVCARMGLVMRYGGLRVPYERVMHGEVEGDDAENAQEKGEIRIAFDGARKDYNLLFAVRVLLAIKRAYAIFAPSCEMTYDLRELRKNDRVRLWLDVLSDVDEYAQRDYRRDS